ncbi:MAG: cadherin-like domain-containing protein, partial [Nitrospirae bacterium]|nr:cadherin-like domain-containing protein [Nitrospirota bacterium]
HFYANALMLKAVQSVNVPPEANDDTATTDEDTSVDIDVISNDTDPDGAIAPATVSITDNPAHGTAVANTDGTVTYTPNAGFSGIDTFTYTVKDNEGATSNEATVRVTVSETFVITGSVLGSHGTISCTSPVNYGGTSTCTIIPDSHYHLSALTDNGADVISSVVNNQYTITNVTVDHTVVATFSLDTYTVTPSAGPNGSINPSTPQTVNYGSTTSFTVTPDTGYHIDSVSGTCGGTLVGNTYNTNPITVDCTVIATFTIDSYTITTRTDNRGVITCSPNPVNHGDTSVCVVTPEAGYYVDVVRVDGSPAELNSKKYTFTNVTSNHRIAVTFAPYTTVTLISPNVIGSIPSGSSWYIRWQAPPNSRVKLLLSLNNGQTWSLIAKDISDTMKYLWTVPTVARDKTACFIKVIAYNSKGIKIGEDISNSPFKINVVRIITPNDAGISLRSGDTYNITWTIYPINSDVAKLKLYYTTNGGITWNPICDPSTGRCNLLDMAGSFEWRVPSVNHVRTMCRIKVELKDAEGNVLGQDSSNNYFKIRP